MTTLHVQRAIDGESDSRAWIVEHFTPALLLQARYRLRGALRSYCDPEDLVDDVWTATLPRLPDLVARDGRCTPVLIKFLSQTLLHKASQVARSYARQQRPRREDSLPPASSSLAGIDRFAGAEASPSAGAEVREMRALVRDRLEALDPLDREILVLRGIEQIANQRVAEKLGEHPSTVSMRYRRALQKLRKALPDSVFAELPDDVPSGEAAKNE